MQIIECSDVGLEPEVEKEMEEIKAFGLQTGENEDKSEYSLKVRNYFFFLLVFLINKYKFSKILIISLTTASYQNDCLNWPT